MLNNVSFLASEFSHIHNELAPFHWSAVPPWNQSSLDSCVNRVAYSSFAVACQVCNLMHAHVRACFTRDRAWVRQVVFSSSTMKTNSVSNACKCLARCGELANGSVMRLYRRHFAHHICRWLSRNGPLIVTGHLAIAVFSCLSVKAMP